MRRTEETSPRRQRSHSIATDTGPTRTSFDLDTVLREDRQRTAQRNRRAREAAVATYAPYPLTSSVARQIAAQHRARVTSTVTSSGAMASSSSEGPSSARLSIDEPEFLGFEDVGPLNLPTVSSYYSSVPSTSSSALSILSATGNALHSPIPSTSSSALSILSATGNALHSPIPSTPNSYLKQLHNARRMTRENEHFLRRTNLGTPILYSYTKAMAAEDDEDKVCSLCMEDFDDDVIVPECGHIIHEKCLRDWHSNIIVKNKLLPPNKQNAENTCPICEQVVTRVANKIRNPKEFQLQKYP